MALAVTLFSGACAAPTEDRESESSSSESLAAGPGSIDPSFGANCKDTTAHFTVVSGVYALLLPDGKILTALSAQAPGAAAWSFGLARFLPSGAVDTSFGSGGFVLTTWGDSTITAEVDGLALAPDGKIVVGGTRTYVVTDASGAMTQPVVFAAARYTANGALDTSFGQGGKVETAVLGKSDRARAVLVQPDGKVLMGGQARQKVPGYSGSDITALVRFNSNGTLDSTFGQGGIVTVIGPSIAAMALESNGNIFVASPTIQRFTPAGALISTPFSGSLVSITATDFGSIAIQSDGKRVLAVGARQTKHSSIPAVTRVAVDGTVEFTTPGFNFGSPVTNVSATPEALLVEANGRIIAGGVAALSGGGTGFGLAAVQPNGTIDAAFGGPTGFTTNLTGRDSVTALLQQADAKIVAVGPCANGIGLARYIGP